MLAESIGEEVAERLRAESEPEPEPVEPEPEQRRPYHQLVRLPQGTGVSGSDYTVGVDPMLPLSVMCLLTTSAAVADRTVAVEYRNADGTRFVLAGTQAVVQANGRQSFCWWTGAGAVTWPVEDAAIAPLPEQYLTWDQHLAVVVSNGDSGDVLGNVIVSARFDPA